MQRVFEYGDHWLHRRRDTPHWHIYWCRPGTRRVCRSTTGTSDFEAAKRFLIAFVDERAGAIKPSRNPPSHIFAPSIPTARNHSMHGHTSTRSMPPSDARSPLLLDVLSTYVNRLEGRPSHATACYVLKGWMEFCAFANLVYVHEMTLGMQERFIAWKRPSRSTGLPVSNGTVNRFLDVLRSAFQDAWRRGELDTFTNAAARVSAASQPDATSAATTILRVGVTCRLYSLPRCFSRVRALSRIGST